MKSLSLYRSNDVGYTYDPASGRFVVRMPRAPFYYETGTPSAEIRGMYVGYGPNIDFAKNWLNMKAHLGVTIVTSTL